MEDSPFFLSSPFSAPFSPDSCFVCDRTYLSSAYAAYDRQIQSYLMMQTESGTVYVLSYAFLCPGFYDCLGTLNAWDCDCGSGHGESGEVVNGSMNDVDLCPYIFLYLVSHTSVRPFPCLPHPSLVGGFSRPDRLCGFCPDFCFAWGCRTLDLSWTFSSPKRNRKE
jgi:hypothetical protein